MRQIQQDQQHEEIRFAAVVFYWASVFGVFLAPVVNVFAPMVLA